MSTILETAGLTKVFGAVTAASNISVALEEDSIVGLIGGNGAGKTTFLNLVTGYLAPTSGTVRFQGRDITGLAPRRITRLGICRSFQIPQVFDSLTTYENLLVGLGIVALGRKAFVGSALGDQEPEQVAEEMLERFRLREYCDASASETSGDCGDDARSAGVGWRHDPATRCDRRLASDGGRYGDSGHDGETPSVPGSARGRRGGRADRRRPRPIRADAGRS